MQSKTQNILSLDNEKAMDFFMKSPQFHGFELPEYFVFNKVLNYVRETIGDKSYEESLNEKVKPEDLSDVNFYFI